MASPVDTSGQTNTLIAISDGNVFRGLNTKLFRDDQPTEGNFIMKKRDPLEDGPSHFIVTIIPKAVVPSLLTPPAEKWKVIELSVQEILAPVLKSNVQMIHLPDPALNEYSEAHAVLYGYQQLTNKEIMEFNRYLVSLARRELAIQN